ncbi:MAG: monovalent cation/H(+) antiporter subunit G [Clostridiales bacterium]|nr:monovalent cation/H(+) antiporter subunit G [Clostridiales bacterium]
MLEWIRFGLSAVLMLGGLFFLLSGVVGQYRFHYVLNRMHAASMGDSLGLGLVLLSLCVSADSGWLIVKYLLVILFVWVTSPTAGHLIGRLEIATDEQHKDEMEMTRK